MEGPVIHWINDPQRPSFFACGKYLTDPSLLLKESGMEGTLEPGMIECCACWNLFRNPKTKVHTIHVMGPDKIMSKCGNVYKTTPEKFEGTPSCKICLGTHKAGKKRWMEIWRSADTYLLFWGDRARITDKARHYITADRKQMTFLVWRALQKKNPKIYWRGYSVSIGAGDAQAIYERLPKKKTHE